jgi:hypothetical protein
VPRYPGLLAQELDRNVARIRAVQPKEPELAKLVDDTYKLTEGLAERLQSLAEAQEAKRVDDEGSATSALIETAKAGDALMSSWQLRCTEARVSGRLAPEVIQRIVRANFGQARACYEDGLRRDPNLRGMVRVRYPDPGGAVRLERGRHPHRALKS